MTAFQSQLSFDFLIFTLTPVSERHRKADARKTHALNSVGVPLISQNSEALPDAAGILAALTSKPTATKSSS